MCGSQSLYNQIAQGLQECRLVLACVTNTYNQSENCQQEITLAERLNRPIITLLLGNTKWPLSGKLGQKLSKYECLKHAMTYKAGVISVDSENIKEICDEIDKYIPNSVTKTQTLTKINENVQTQDDKENKESNPDSVNPTVGRKQAFHKMESGTLHIKKAKHKIGLPKTASMFELRSEQRKIERRSSHAMVRDDMLVGTKGLPHGLVVNEDGYTVKTERSKSCVIL